MPSGLNTGIAGPNATGRNALAPVITVMANRVGRDAGFQNTTNPINFLHPKQSPFGYTPDRRESPYTDGEQPIPRQEVQLNIRALPRQLYPGFQASPVDPRTVLGHVGTMPQAASALEQTGINKSLGLSTSMTGNTGRNVPPPAQAASPAAVNIRSVEQSQLAPAS
jgi:hypothetical protein